MLSKATPAQKEAPCPSSELIATAGDTNGSVEDVTLVDREAVVVTSRDVDVDRMDSV